MSCECVTLRASDAVVPTVCKPPCVELRCTPLTPHQDVRTDIFAEKCVTVACDDGSNPVTKCVTFSTVLFNATAEQIATVQAQLAAQALSEATALANAELECPGSGNTEQHWGCEDEHGAGYRDRYSFNQVVDGDGFSVVNGVVYIEAGRFPSNESALAAVQAKFAEFIINGDIDCCSCNGQNTTVAPLHWYGQFSDIEVSPANDLTGCNGGTIGMLGGSGTFDLTTNGSGPSAVCIYSDPWCSDGPKKLTWTVVVSAGTTGRITIPHPAGWTIDGGSDFDNSPSGTWRELAINGPGTYTLVAHSPTCALVALQFTIEQDAADLVGTISLVESDDV